MFEDVSAGAIFAFNITKEYPIETVAVVVVICFVLNLIASIFRTSIVDLIIKHK